jgi:hypothetical protein
MLCGLLRVTPTPEVQFTDITQASGINFKHENSATSNKYLVETMGGGVAVLDYDNDGRLDVFFTNGAKIDDPLPDGKLPDKADRKFWNRLYHQNADGTFTDVTEKAGLTGMPQNRYGMGVAVGDYDNDGFEDIYVTGYGGNTLYHNNGNGTFTDVTKMAGVESGGWSASAGFFDYDNDGKLDLLVTRYLDWSFKTNRYCGEQKPGYRAYCHPDNYDGATNVLYHNNGNGTFSEVGLLAGVGYNEDGKAFAGMGADFSDFDNDGRPDIVVTDLSNERYMLFRNNGDSTFRDVTNVSGLGGATLAFSGWSTHLFDFDNDGWKDIFVAQGHVMDTIHLTSPNLKYMQPPLLMRNESGHFKRVILGPAFQTEWAGRGAAFGDLDNDGDVDIVMSSVGQKATVLRNEGGNRNHWLQLRLVGARSNRDGIGVKIRIVAGGRTQVDEAKGGGSYQSAHDPRIHFGLGIAERVDLLELRWPSGAVDRLTGVAVDRVVTVKEAAR